MSEPNVSTAGQGRSTSVVDLAPGHYVVDPAASGVVFVTKHMFGSGSVRGSFGRVEGTIDITAPVAASSGRLQIDATSFDSAHSRRDQVVRSDKLLNVEEHPLITVSFDHIELTGSGSARAVASVTARGGTAPVEASLTDLNVTGDTVRGTVKARVDRYAHGVGGFRGMVGRHLEITVDLVARRRT